MGPSFPTRDGFTPPPHPHRRGARPMRIESDNYPRLEKGSQSAGGCRLKQIRHVVISFWRVSEFAYVLYTYIYICIYMSKKFIYIIFKFVLRVVERGFEELTQCNKKCGVWSVKCKVESVECRVKSVKSRV